MQTIAEFFMHISVVTAPVLQLVFFILVKPASSSLSCSVSPSPCPCSPSATHSPHPFTLSLPPLRVPPPSLPPLLLLSPLLFLGDVVVLLFLVIILILLRSCISPIAVSLMQTFSLILHYLIFLVLLVPLIPSMIQNKFTDMLSSAALSRGISDELPRGTHTRDLFACLYFFSAFLHPLLLLFVLPHCSALPLPLLLEKRRSACCAFKISLMTTFLVK